MSKTKNALSSNISIIVAVVALLSVASVLGSRDEVSTAAGVLTGGALAVAALLVARARARKRPEDAGPVDRVAAGMADERDRAVQQQAYAFTGIAALVLACAGSVAATLGMDAAVIVGALPLALVVALVIGYVLSNRRM